MPDDEPVTRHGLRQRHEGVRRNVRFSLNQTRGELIVLRWMGEVPRLVNEGNEGA